MPLVANSGVEPGPMIFSDATSHRASTSLVDGPSVARPSVAQ